MACYGGTVYMNAKHAEWDCHEQADIGCEMHGGELIEYM